MNLNTFPTKGNLIITKNSLKLAKQGYELMDKKRNILISELTALIDEAKNIQSEIDVTFTQAYKALQEANIELGINYVQEIAEAMPVEESITIKTRSVMGTEIPLAQMEEEDLKPTFAFYSTRDSLDEVRMAFDKVKRLTVRLSTVENSAYRLAANIKKTQKRANALENITIPTYSELCVNIQAALEEKEREEFTRLKVIKRNKENKGSRENKEKQPV
ncbi:MAG TPA: V-type ATP synthase subunit D [Lachnospiraceae bacterium]|jgi:V/A-type H+/Na+-transporting ATPase subunit D|nr:V-type ATP synthase subunit D [Lachnospiraceae bacterium]